jgi:peptidoglycan-associated lipoprotein
MRYAQNQSLKCCLRNAGTFVRLQELRRNSGESGPAPGHSRPLFSLRASGALSLAALAVIASVACGGDKPAPAKSPAPKATATATPTASKEAVDERVKASPTVSAANIDPAITKACGLSAVEAYFAFDSSQVRPEDGSTLEKVAVCFLSGPLKGRTLRIVGHTDGRGTDEYNMVLGLSRADTIGNYVKTHALPEKQVQTTSRGKLDARGTDDASWAKDRRVDLLLE